MTKFVRNSLWIGTGLQLCLCSCGASRRIRFCVANYCGQYSRLIRASALRSLQPSHGFILSARSIDRIPSIFAVLAIVLTLDTLLVTRHLQKFWEDPLAIPLAIAWFGGVLVYHLRKYRGRTPEDGV